MLSNEFKERVREATDIVDIVSRFTQLKAKGKTLTGLCPLPGHTEKTPSFTVNRDQQFYYCFGCQRGGDIFKFAQEVMGHSFLDALEYFAEKAGIPAPTYHQSQKFSALSSASSQKKATLFKINALAKNIFQKQLALLKANHPVRVYLQDRGFLPQTIEAFQIGYAPNDWTFLSKQLSEHKNLAQTLGLMKKQASQEYFDIYRNRIMFPIINIKDEVAGFGGRCLTESNKEPKYINSPTSDIFHKGKMLYGLHLAAASIRSLNQVIIVEGYTDVVMLHQNGFKNVVGVLGTALTTDHTHLLKRYTRNIVVLFDSDEAGQKATKKALPILLEAGFYPRSLDLPSGQDPDMAIKTWGKALFQKRLKEAPDLFDCLLKEHLTKRSLTPSNKVQILDDMGRLIVKTKDERLKSLYIQTLAKHLDLPTQTIWQSLRSIKSQKIDFSPTPQTADQEKYRRQQTIKIEEPADKAELMIAGIVANHPKYLKVLEEQDILKQISSEKISCFLKKIQDLARHKPANLDNLLTYLWDLEANRQVLDKNFHLKLDSQLLEIIAFIGSEEDQSKINKYFEDGLHRIKERFLNEKARIAIHQTKNDVGSVDLKKFMDIQKTKHRLT